MTGGGWLGPIAYRAFGRFHRDARLILATTLVTGAALSLWWIDFNLYLQALGLSTAEIGLIGTIGSVAGGLVAFPASAASDRVGRRRVFALGILLALVALGVLAIAGASVPLIVLSAALWSAGNNAVGVVVAPFLTEHSEAEHRNELFAIQFAIQNLTNVVAAILGGVVATLIAGWIGLDPAGPGAYRVILVIMAILLVVGLASVRFLTDDSPSVAAGPRLQRLGEPAAFPPDPRRRRARFGITVRDRGRFARLLFPGFLISLGAGQVIPYLNLFVRGKFGLNLVELNAVFAVTALGTIAAILVQPRLARRFGQITSVVIVQAASLPFLVMLGFSPILWTVVVAMAVRSSLMNAGNPIFTAFAMEHVDPAERATASAAMNVLWQLGWVIGGLFYSVLQATVGFDAGYTVNFVAIIGLYSVGTALTWFWFHDTDARRLGGGKGTLATGR